MTITSSPELGLWRRQGMLVYLASRFVFNLLTRMLVVVLGWHIYDLTGDPMHLGYVGLAMFLPILVFGFLAGDMADRFNRGAVVMGGYGFALAAAAGFWVLARSESPDLFPLYSLTALFGTAIAMSKPALWTVLPALVPHSALPVAVSWASLASQMGTIAGPVTGGLLLIGGVSTGYLGIAFFALAGLVLTARVLPMTPAVGGEQTAQGALQRTMEGISYIFKVPLMLGMVLLDLLAVLLGSVVVLLPVFARDILDVGPEGLGALRAAPAVGAVVAGLVLARAMPRRNAGRILLSFTALFGVSVLVFAFSRDITLSLIALAVAGGSDAVSAIMRHTIVQLGTPDAMRGRVTSVAQMFIGASNELGDFRAGAVAAWLGAVPAAALGGVCTIVVAAGGAALFPALRRLSDPRGVRPRT